MKSILILFSLLILSAPSWSQNTNLDYKYAVKVYNSFSYQQQSTYSSYNFPYSIRSTTETIRLLDPSVAFQWKSKKNNLHEIELKDLSLNITERRSEVVNDTTGKTISSSSGYQTVNNRISLRYEYIINAFKSKERKLIPSLGFGVNPYFVSNKSIPRVSSSFTSAVSTTGIRTFITPRLTYYFSPRMFFDLNIPLCFTDTYFDISEDANPSRNPATRKVTTLTFEMAPKLFSARFGLGMKL